MEENITTPENNGTTIVEAVKTVDELTAEVASLAAQIVSLKADNDYKTGRVEFYRNRVNEYSADVTRLNEFMNAKADEESWCSSYDAEIEGWNSSFTQIELTGRRKEFTVELDVTLRYTHYYTVEATSEDAAREEIQQMSEYDLLDNLDYGDTYDTNIDIESIEVA